MNILLPNRLNELSMIQSNIDASEFSMFAQGRRFLEQGEVDSALECYRNAYDPDSLDEREARSMLIEARAHLLRKHIFEALDAFEEALLMGTDVQRRQAIEGIETIAGIKAKLPDLIIQIKKIFKEKLGKRIQQTQFSLVSDSENVVIISSETLENLPAPLAKSPKLTRIPEHIQEQFMPFHGEKCIPFIDEDDIKFISEIAREIKKTASGDTQSESKD
jgi:tetratricopeptide (TPR) repeat protein